MKGRSFLFRYFSKLANELHNQEMASPDPVRWYHWFARVLFVVATLCFVAETF